MDDSDELVFAEETAVTPSASSEDDPWKVLIVDDEEQVHRVTRLALSDFRFEGKSLRLLHAYSGEEAKRIMARQADVAVILLDVVMETDDAGLDVIRHIRRDLSNHLVRIILRTGQPGQAPEDKVIIDFDINDYKAKTELTAQRLFNTMVTSLRSFRDLMTIERNKVGLQKIIDASPSLFKIQSMKEFTSGVLTQLSSILRFDSGSLFGHSFVAHQEEGEFFISAGTGKYLDCQNQRVEDVARGDGRNLIDQAVSQKCNLCCGKDFVGYIAGQFGADNLIYIQGWHDMDPVEQDLMKVFFTNISVAYDNIYLNHEIEDTQREIIFTLGEVAEARSKETGKHVRRVAEYCRLLTLLSGRTQDEAELIRIASPMHDVGKLAIPDAILLKPGRLSVDEWETMKSHVMIGYEMLKRSRRNIMQTAALVALQHHEKYNGEGYPRGLKGEEIHFFGRVAALADVFDALSCARSYKKPWPLPAIFEYLLAERGKHFDPQLVDLFIRHRDQFVAIWEAFTQPWERAPKEATH